MLCHDAGIMNTPISAKSFTTDQNQRAEQAGLSNWIAGRTMSSCSRRYGITSTKVSSIRPARLYKTQNVDLDKKREIQQNIVEFNAEQAMIQDQLQQLKTDGHKLQVTIKEIEGQRAKIVAEKSAKQEEASNFVKNTSRLERQQNLLKEAEQEGENYHINIKRLESELEKLAMKRAQASIDYIVCTLNTIDLDIY